MAAIESLIDSTAETFQRNRADMLACLVGHGPAPVPFQNHDTSHVIIASRRRSRPGCPQ